MFEKIKAYWRGNAYRPPGNARDRPIIRDVSAGRIIKVAPDGNLVFATCVKLLATYLSQIRWGVYGAKFDASYYANTALAPVLNAVPYPGINAHDFWYMMEVDRETAGNAYAYIRMEGGVLQELIRLDPDYMKIYWDDAGVLDAFLQGNRKLIYEYRDPITQRQYVFLPEELIHLKAHSINGIVGRRAIDVLSGALNADAEVEGAMRTAVHNGFAGTIVLSYTSDLSVSRQKTLQKQIQELLANTNNTILPLPAGMKADNIANDVTAYYSALKNTDVQSISAFFGIPLVMLNIGGGTGMGTFSATQMAQFYGATIAPIVDAYASELTAKLLSTKQIGAGFTFDSTNDIFDFLDPEAKSSVLCAYTGAGILTANEARKSIKYSPSSDAMADKLTQRGGTGSLGDSPDNEGGKGNTK